MIISIGLILLFNKFINKYLDKASGIYYLIPDHKLNKMLLNLGFKKIVTTYKDKELVYYTKTLTPEIIEWNTIINNL